MGMCVSDMSTKTPSINIFDVCDRLCRFATQEEPVHALWMASESEVPDRNSQCELNPLRNCAQCPQAPPKQIKRIRIKILS